MKKSTSALIFIFVTVLVDVIGFGIIIPVIPDLLQDLTGSDLSESSAYGGGLMIAFASMQFLFSPVLGEFSDKYGRRPVLLLALFGLSIDYLLHAFAPTITWLFIGRILAGICGASFTVANAYIADISTAEDKAKNFGLIGAAFGVGFIVGPALGGILGQIDIRMPFYFAAGLTFLNFLFGYFMVPESLDEQNRREVDYRKMMPGVSIAKIGKYAGIAGLIFAFFLANIAGQTLPAIWNFYTKERFDWSIAEVGYSLTFVGVTVAIVQGGLIGTLVKKLGEHKVIVGGFLLWTLGMTLFAMSTEGWMIYAFMIPYALGGVAGPTLQGMLSNHVSESEQGNLQGALTSLISITSIIGPAIATGLFYSFTGEHAIAYFPGAPFVSAAIFLLIAAIIVIFSLKKIRVTEASK